MTMVHIEGEDKGKIILYALSTCVWCKKTKKLLTELGVDFHYVFVDLLKEDEIEKVMDEIKLHNPACSFPTLVFDDKTCILGYNERMIREALGK